MSTPVKQLGAALKGFYTQALDFDTPMNRRDYWTVAGFYAATTVVVWYFWTTAVIFIATTNGSIFRTRQESIMTALPWLVGFTVWLIIQTLPFLAATSRRLIDAGYHWGLSLLTFIPGVNLFVLAACVRPTVVAVDATTKKMGEGS